MNFTLLSWRLSYCVEAQHASRIKYKIYRTFIWKLRGVGTLWCNWLRKCATSRKVAGSILDGETGIFLWHNPSLALGLTQPLTEMSTRNISWGIKAAGAKGWQPCQFHVPIVLKSGRLNIVEHSGSVQTSNGVALPLYLTLIIALAQSYSFVCHSQTNISCCTEQWRSGFICKGNVSSVRVHSLVES